MKIAIIGSGLSGLSCAATLAKQNHTVDLYEQNDQLGGVTASMQKNGYTWDLGPMIVPDLGKDEPGGKLLKFFNIYDRVAPKKLSRTFNFPDYTITRKPYCSGKDWLKDELTRLFPSEADGITRYYRYHEKVMDIGALQNKAGLINIVKLLVKYFSLGRKKSWSAQDLIDEYFNNQKLKAFFVSILADYVCSPSDFPGIAIPIINSTVEFDERTPLDTPGHDHRSSWCVIPNGTISLVNALSDVFTQNGGNVKTSTTVTKVIIEDKKAVCLTDNKGNKHRYDRIVASGGLDNLFKNMVGLEHLSTAFIEKYLQAPSLTESVFMLNLGVDYDITQHQQAPICYYYNTYDVDKSIKECKRGYYHKGDDGFLVYIFTAYPNHMAPNGKHAVQIYTIAPNTPTNGDWDKDKQAWADHLLKLAEKHLPGLTQHIVAQHILTPKDFQNITHLEHHSFGGCTPNIHISPPPHKTPVKNLWFIGAQSSAFGGVTSAMMSGNKVANLINKGK